MAESNILRIRPPGEGRSAEEAAREVLELIRGGYRWNIATLGYVFSAERQFVTDYIKPRVKCISVNKFFGDYIIEKLQPEPEIVSLLQHGRYLFQEEDLLRFWQENAVADRRTVLVDLARYRLPRVDLFTFQQAFRQAQSRVWDREEKKQRKGALCEMLTPEGKRFYAMQGKKSPHWEPTELPALPLHTYPKLMSTSRIMLESGGSINSTSVAFQHMYAAGATHITLLGRKVLWHYDLHTPVTAIAVPADFFRA